MPKAEGASLSWTVFVYDLLRGGVCNHGQAEHFEMQLYGILMST